MSERLKRQDVPVKMTWDLDALFSSTDAWKAHLETMNEEVKKILAFKGRIKEGGKTLFEAIETEEKFVVQLIALGTYASLNQSVDGVNTKVQEMSMTFGSVATQMSSQLSFLDSEILELSEEAFKKAFDEEPRLEVYKNYLENLYDEKQYKLSPETEEVLSSMGELTGSPYRTYSVSKAADMTFDKILDKDGQSLENSFALFEGKYEYSEDPVLRANAYASFNKTLKAYENTYASIYSTEVKKQVAMSRIRGYESVTQMLLKPQQVTEEMYHRQIDVIYETLAPHMQKFANLLKKELGLEKLNFYDLKAPIDTSYNPPATYEQARDTVLESLEIMGEDYVKIMKTAFDDRWIDYSDNVGKATGAFCSSPYAAHPYILVSFQDNMRDAFTLTHELGHAGHFYLANKHQKAFNTRPSTYMVEAPSTMNEMLLGRHLMSKTDDPKLKKWVILQFLGTYYHNFVTHLLEARYQREVYKYAEKGQPLTASLLTSTMLEVQRGFWKDSVDIDDNAGLTWMRQPHYYMGLYPYTYSAGLTASTAVSEMIFEEGKPAVDRWIEMLKSGGTQKPLDLLKIAGLDMTTDAPLKKAIAYVGTLVDQLTDLCK